MKKDILLQARDIRKVFLFQTIGFKIKIKTLNIICYIPFRLFKKKTILFLHEKAGKKGFTVLEWPHSPRDAAHSGEKRGR